MVEKVKRAKRARTNNEFNLVQLATALSAPMQTSGLFAWEMNAIRRARDAQMSGSMKLADQLAMSIKTDSGIFTALQNRLAPQRSLPVELSAPDTCAQARCLKIEAEPLFGERGNAFSRASRLEVNECLATHGFAVAQNVYTPRNDGSRVDVEVRPWPMAPVRWNAARCTLETQTERGCVETITHGDGRWIIFALARARPWGWGALLPAALVWADRAYGIRDRSRTGTSHGNAKMVGELPAGIPIDSKEGAAFLLLLKKMHESLPFGIKPHGAQMDMLVNSSTAWQIFKEIIDSNLADAARIYLGHDGTIKAAGGNYIKDGYLFGVSSDIVSGDLSTIEEALFTGSIEPWSAINFGTSEHAPRMQYMVPDPDEDTVVDAVAKRRKLFYEDLAAAAGAKLTVDQAFIEARAREYRVVAPLVAGPGEDVALEAATELAAEMTRIGLDRCEHQRKNRCPLCGVERVREVSVDDLGNPVYGGGWKAIGATKSSSPSLPDPADQEELRGRAQRRAASAAQRRPALRSVP